MKVLFVATCDFLHRQNDGGTQYNFQNYQMLQHLYGKENIYTLCICAHEPGAIPNTLFLPDNTRPWNRLLSCVTERIYYDRAIEEKALAYFVKENFDLIVVDSLDGRWVHLFKKKKPELKILLIPHNLEKQYYMKRVKQEGIHLLPLWWGVVRSEKHTVRSADWMSVLNQRDKKSFEKIYHRTPDVILPISFADHFDQARADQSSGDLAEKTLLFVGSLFAPNLDGVQWFIREVLIRLPGYRLVIVGKNFETKKAELENDQVRVIGTVDDLAEYYYRFAAQIIPIRYGYGMKVKTAEAMMYGKTIFASDEALEGYEVDNVKGIYRCNTPEEYLQAIQNFFAQKTQPRWQTEVRKCFLEKYELQVVERKLYASLKEKRLLDQNGGSVCD